jgi:hypothetical protein
MVAQRAAYSQFSFNMGMQKRRESMIMKVIIQCTEKAEKYATSK